MSWNRLHIIYCVLMIIQLLTITHCVTVNGDAALLMTEMLKIFVQGKKPV